MNTQVCPRCGKAYTGYPAVSRHGLGDICSRCGHVEAFEALGMSAEKVEQLADEIERREAEVRAEVEAVNAGLKPSPWGKD